MLRKIFELFTSHAVVNQQSITISDNLNEGTKMNLLADISALIAALEGILKLAEAVDPNAANNPIVVKVQNVINELKSLNL